jgi:hypothetical protein
MFLKLLLAPTTVVAPITGMAGTPAASAMPRSVSSLSGKCPYTRQWERRA